MLWIWILYKLIIQESRDDFLYFSVYRIEKNIDSTISPRSSYQFYTVTYYIKWVLDTQYAGDLPPNVDTLKDKIMKKIKNQVSIVAPSSVPPTRWNLRLLSKHIKSLIAEKGKILWRKSWFSCCR